jgi:hypothetical protein
MERSSRSEGNTLVCNELQGSIKRPTADQPLFHRPADEYLPSGRLSVQTVCRSLEAKEEISLLAQFPEARLGRTSGLRLSTNGPTRVSHTLLISSARNLSDRKTESLVITLASHID